MWNKYQGQGSLCPFSLWRCETNTKVKVRFVLSPSGDVKQIPRSRAVGCLGTEFSQCFCFVFCFVKDQISYNPPPPTPPPQKKKPQKNNNNNNKTTTTTTENNNKKQQQQKQTRRRRRRRNNNNIKQNPPNKKKSSSSLTSSIFPILPYYKYILHYISVFDKFVDQTV